MVKIFFVCRRRQGLAVAEYRRMVLEEHVPLALEHHRTMLRYEINLVHEPGPGAQGPVSIPALCFDSLADYQERLYASEEGRAIIEADAARFMGGAEAYLTEELVVSPGRPRGPLGQASAGQKTIITLSAAQGLSSGGLAERLAAIVGPSASAGHGPEGPERLVLNPVTRRLSENAPEWSHFIEFHRRVTEEQARETLGGLVTELACWAVDEYVEK